MLVFYFIYIFQEIFKNKYFIIMLKIITLLVNYQHDYFYYIYINIVKNFRK